MQDAEWGEIVGVVLDPSQPKRERDAAQWKACAEVVRSLEAYRPAGFRAPPGWHQGDERALDGVRRGQQDIEALRGAAEAVAGSFARWRLAVWDHEAAEAAKLEVIVWVARTLSRLRDEQPNAQAVIDRLMVAIGDLVVDGWRLGNLPLQGDYRQWAIRSTRRYDLLPKAWRYV